MKFYNMNLFLISISPWPIVFSLSLLFFCLNLTIFLNSMNYFFLIVSLVLILINMFLWWNDVILESSISGFHNMYIINMTMNSMIMFIVSELFFFISFFWTFMNSMFSPDIIIGSIWPSFGIISINYMNLPLLNSILLLSSGSTITWSHYMFMIKKNKVSMNTLCVTFILGLIFLICQMWEYKFSYFCFSDSIFGSIFFIATGFHGIHVLIGSIFLILMFFRMYKNHFSKLHFLGFEFSIWYWHFVDVVWLYLYMMVYWLGS